MARKLQDRIARSQRKAQPVDLDGRLRFVLPDGNVVMNRGFDLANLKQAEFMAYTIGIDARDKGVRPVGAYKVEGNIVVQQVEWL